MTDTLSTTEASAYEAKWVMRLRQAREQMLGEMHKIIVGQEEVLEQLVYAVLCRGHCLLEGVPGLAKTVMVQTLGATLNLSFRRIQFTPDLMPSDITGTDIIQERGVGRLDRLFRLRVDRAPFGVLRRAGGNLSVVDDEPVDHDVDHVALVLVERPDRKS